MIPYWHTNNDYKQLRCLHILETEMSEEDIECLSKLPELKELSIYDQDVKYVKYLPTLGSLTKVESQICHDRDIL